MGIIKTDPSQTKTVVGLLIILAAAIAVTVLRITGGSEPPAPITKETGPSNEPRIVRTTNESAVSPSRNPFKSPPGYKAARNGEENELPGIKKLSDNHIEGEWDASNSSRIEPLKINSKIMVSASENTEPKEITNAEEIKREFTLLSTVKSGDAWCAVIRSGDSGEKVVEVGDKLEGGFVVKELSANRAVLANGRDTIIAKRPRS